MARKIVGVLVFLPAPVAIIVRNLDGGGMAVHVANFVPTKEE